jgi:hypothetical protein
MMKVTVNVECTPEEARIFMGLPDVQPMQQAILQDLQGRMQNGLDALSPEAMMTNWLPTGLQNAEQLQKMFWGQIQNALAGVTNATTAAMVTFTDRKAVDKS